MISLRVQWQSAPGYLLLEYFVRLSCNLKPQAILTQIDMCLQLSSLPFVGKALYLISTEERALLIDALI